MEVEIDRLYSWLYDKRRQPPELEFTEGPARRVADHIVMLEARLSNYEQLATAAAELRRGCTCRYDDRCANCDRIVRVIDLAKKLLNPPTAEEKK